MPNWYAYKKLATNEVGFTTDASQGFSALQSNPAFSVHAIAGQPAADQFFDISDNTIKAIPKTQAKKDREAARTRLKTLALKGGKNLTQQDRDELLCLRTLLDLGEL